jgi:hypothetical protein
MGGSAGHGEAGGFSFWVALCFTVNVIMGTGFLTLPLAFSQTGEGGSQDEEIVNRR